MLGPPAIHLNVRDMKAELKNYLPDHNSKVFLSPSFLSSIRLINLISKELIQSEKSHIT